VAKFDPFRRSPEFPTTQLSLVAAAVGTSSQARDALAALCRAYWYPLYAFVRRQGHDCDSAQDLTQEFFASLLEQNYLRSFDRERGKFRSFLLACLKHFLANEHDRRRAAKRGGSVEFVPMDVFEAGEDRYAREPGHEQTPERVFEREWALELLAKTTARLEHERVQAGRSKEFESLRGFLAADELRMPYRTLAEKLETSEGALKTAVHRLRGRFRELLREEISNTIASPQDVRDEIEYLITVLSRS
jgi:RNA polymerase sigma factor (sigma-70 family)